MEDFASILHRDYGLKPQGKSAPMATAASKSVPLPSSSAASFTGSSLHRTSSSGLSKNGSDRGNRSSTPPILSDPRQDDFFFGGNGMRSSSARSTFGSGGSDPLAGGSGAYDDVFGGPPKFAPPTYPSSQAQSAQNFDDIFRGLGKTASSNKGSSLPVFDAPLYDDDIFGGVPGVRNANVAYDDVFSAGTTAGPSPAVFEDLLGGYGTADSRERATQGPVFDSAPPSAGESAFDELLPGFGGSEPAKSRSAGDGKPSQRKSPGPAAAAANDPFVILDSTPVTSGASVSSVSDLDPFKSSSRSSSGNVGNDSSNGASAETAFGNSSSSSPTIPFTANKPVNTTKDPRRRKEFVSPGPSPTRLNVSSESTDGSSGRRNHSNYDRAKDQTKISSSSPKPELQTKIPSGNVKREADAPVSSAEAATYSPSRRYRQVSREAADSSHRLKSEDPTDLPKVSKTKQADEFWISIEDIKLVTKPTTAPPPSRPPPAPGSKQSFAAKRPVDAPTTGDQDSVTNLNGFTVEEDGSGSLRHESQRATESSMRSSDNTPNTIDELEEFASGGSRAHKDLKEDLASSTTEDEQTEESSAAAASGVAMKEAMERAEAKLKLAKETKEREREREARAARSRDEREKTRESREREKKETGLERGEKEREARVTYDKEERERDEREREARERRRKEREKEKEREREREREKDRIAVERATQEARERAAAEAREKAERIAERAALERENERIAVERATQEARERAAADARERAERAAVGRATAEARDRAATDARERAAERAAVERAASEARARAERAAVERVNAEARARAGERAATEARERADRAAAERATAAREQQRRNDNDLESFFMSTRARPTSAPRQRPPTADSSSVGVQSNKGFSNDGQQRKGFDNVKKVPSTPNITDDWASLLSGTPSSGEFQEVEGESSERRRARWDRHQRTLERAAKALDEKNQRDLQAQRDQAERHRAAETLDIEVKRWAAGKEGNLRALLSTLQYVLWPECSWQAVSLTDLITGASVKKVYRRATLCVHPDKVQQKGATIQQRYIAEKVFDLLKEAWNKFNSEELF